MMHPLRILLLDSSHLPAVGGKEIVVHHLARQFQNLGHEVAVAGPGSFLKHRKLDLGYPVQRYPSLPWNNADTRWKLVCEIIFRRARYDIVHAHTTYPSGYHAQRWLEKKSATIPLVVTPHGADIHKVPEQNWGKRLDEKIDRKIRWLLTQCAAATAISGSVYDSLLDAGAPAERIHSISNGVDTDRMTSDTGIDARRRLGLPEGCPMVVTVGNYKRIKGHDVIVDALAGCNSDNLYVVIVGRTSPEFVAKTAAGPVGKRVVFTGPLSFPIAGQAQEPDLMAALMQQSTAYVSASVGEGTEGLSLALLEAMAAGTCAVATNISGNRDLITHTENGLLVEPGNTESLTEAFDSLTASAQDVVAMSRAASESISHLSWRRIAEQYVELYQSLLDQQMQTA